MNNNHHRTGVFRNCEFCAKFTFRKKIYLSRKYSVKKFATLPSAKALSNYFFLIRLAKSVTEILTILPITFLFLYVITRSKLASFGTVNAVVYFG